MATSMYSKAYDSVIVYCFFSLSKLVNVHEVLLIFSAPRVL